MADGQSHFEVAGSKTLGDAAGVLAKVPGAGVGREQSVDRTFLDSFDWRLYGSGFVLERLVAGGRKALVLSEYDTGAPVVVVDHRAMPRFAGDLPEGFLRDRLGPLLSMRALMPRVRLKGRRRSFVVRDREGKDVVRGSLEDVQALPPDARKGKAFGVRLYLEPVRGFDKALGSVTAKLGKHPLFAERKGSLYDLAMAQAALTPGDYSSRLRLSLLPEMRADEAMQVILRTLFDAMAANEAGVIADVDTEFLHDFRVAIRRTRSALAHGKEVLPARLVARYKKSFRWLGRVTTPQRDLDVYLLDFEKYRRFLPKAFRDSFDPLRDELARRRAVAHKGVVRTLQGKRYARLKKNWGEALDTLTAKNKAPDAATPVIKLGDKRIWKLYKKVIAEGRAIDDASPAEALHELRITCKKLRYLMEFFESLHDGAKVKDRIRAMKALQDDLGEFQDFAVQAETLTGFAREMERAGTAPRETLMAMAILADALMEKQRAARAAFAAIFEEFASRGGRAEMKALYKK